MTTGNFLRSLANKQKVPFDELMQSPSRSRTLNMQTHMDLQDYIESLVFGMARTVLNNKLQMTSKKLIG